jgi:4-amino-4-deoxy-L-arabinose transferase-like glycosyltransferase
MAISAAREIDHERSGAWARHRATLLAVAICAVAAALRLYRVDANGLSNDESWSVWVAGQSVLGIVRTILFQSVDATPPTYYALLHLSLLLGGNLLAIRAVAILAGTLTVWLTFRFAAMLFGLRAAALSAALLAIAPLHIAYSQIARAYSLAALLALLSLYLFARLRFGGGGRWAWAGFVLATAAAFYTFYLTFLVVIFENLFVAAIWLRRRPRRAEVLAWLASQAARALALLPSAFSVAFARSLSHGRAGYGLTWIARPGLLALVKSAILFLTGDPSYGPTGLTVARALSLALICALAGLGGWLFARRAERGRPADEGPRVLFVAAAALVPWAIVFGVSQARPVYEEKYLLFLMPLLSIVLGWMFTRAGRMALAAALLVLLLGLNAIALHVYYTEPDGEQWREATAQVRAGYQQGDLIVVSPGFYGRPFSYYFAGGFPDNIHALDHTPAVVIDARSAHVLDTAAPGSPPRVWLISGYAAVDPATTAWLARGFTPLDDKAYVGVHVQLLRQAGR